jgi:hypothetical protein
MECHAAQKDSTIGLKMNFKPLPSELKNHGMTMKLVKRTEKVAMYSKCGGYEVVLVQRHNGYEIKGVKVEPAEYLPKDEDFGAKGWHFSGPQGLEMAEKKYLDLQKEVKN